MIISQGGERTHSQPVRMQAKIREARNKRMT